MIKRLFRAAVCSIVFAAFVTGGHRPDTDARAQSIAEFEVKAALIYNFAQFVGWPDKVFSGSNAPFLICVLSEKASSRIMEKTFQGKSVRGREIRIEQSDNLQELKKCQILYISMAMKDRISEIMDAIGSAGVLTIGDIEKFTESGGIIGLYEENGKMRFEVNLDAARRAKLEISSKLLKAGRVVRNN